MQAEVLLPRGSESARGAPGLLSYAVPAALAAVLQPGQLVAVPLGERVAAGVVWSLAEPALPAGEPSGLRALSAVLLPDPVVLPLQRALAEWLADYYDAPLALAARLFLPPGLLSSIRMVLRPSRADAAPPPVAGGPPGDEAVVLALLAERGALTQAEVRGALGVRRARETVGALLARGAVVLTPEPAEAYARTRRDRLVRLVAPADAIAAWRASARARLDALAGERVAQPAPRRSSGTWEPESERLLRQLATVEVLGRAPGESADGGAGAGAWRLAELRRLTRLSPGGLAELVGAGLVVLDECERRHDPLAGRAIARTQALPLTAAQAAALAAITAAVTTTPEPPVFLLHGITGSGKTEVYLQALAATLAAGKRGLALVPEIALTPQAMARYAGRFPGQVALLHSALSDAERRDQWRRIRAGEARIVVGSRSALFAPLDQLGLIVVDEEHEAAYKEERTPSYHAREAAIQLGALAGATVVLGSATPSIEAYWQARRGAYRLLALRERAPTAGAGARRRAPDLPPVRVIDLRAELRAGNTSILSDELRAALSQTLARGEQAILFLNRRGAASSVLCRECGYVARCGRCDISLTYHAGERALICHYCGQREAVPALCPVCRGAGIRYFGVGTERVESAVKRLYPQARVLRWDRDTARTRHAHEELLRAFAERRADVLVGTQMIAKGLDLPGVTLVGVVSADTALFLPDFRASERAFQLLTQVAGRAGRGAQAGQVLMQTFNPDHFCIQAAAGHDYVAFAEAEIAARQRYDYPPLRRFVKCTYAHPDRHTAQREATTLAARLERLIADLRVPRTDLVGPAPAFIERLRGRYRWQVIVRAPDPLPLLRALTPRDLPPGWSVDVDPATTL